MHFHTHLVSSTLLLSAVTSASLLPNRTQPQTCSPLDSSTNSLPSVFSLTGIHLRSGTSTRYLPLVSSLSSTSPSPIFVLDSGVLSTSDETPCFLFQTTDAATDPQVICSGDPTLKDPSTNNLAETTWATGTHCLDAQTEIVKLVPVFAGGVRHSKPFYVNEEVGGEGMLKYCVDSYVDAGPLTSLRLEVMYV